MTKFEFTLKHDEHGEIKTVVEIAATDDFESSYVEMVQQAQKNAASRYVDYESFGNDSVYSDRLDVVGAEFHVLDVQMVSDAPLLRYAIEAEYSTDEHGRWSDWVMARSEDDARFAAKWQMAQNEGGDPDNHDDFQTTMEDITINDCYLEPVTQAEALDYLGTMSRMTIPGDPDFSDESDQSDSEALQAMVRKARDMLAGKHVAA